MTVAPVLQKAAAVAAPIPDVAPVTNATRFCTISRYLLQFREIWLYPKPIGIAMHANARDRQSRLRRRESASF